MYKSVFVKQRKPDGSFPWRENRELQKTFKRGKVHLPRLQYIINLLFKIAQPFTAKRTRDNVSEFLTKRKMKN